MGAADEGRPRNPSERTRETHSRLNGKGGDEEKGRTRGGANSDPSEREKGRDREKGKSKRVRRKEEAKTVPAR